MYIGMAHVKCVWLDYIERSTLDYSRIQWILGKMIPRYTAQSYGEQGLRLKVLRETP